MSKSIKDNKPKALLRTAQGYQPNDFVIFAKKQQ